MRSSLVVVVVMAAVVAAAGGSPRRSLDASGALQLLQRLGLDRGGQAPTVTLAEKLREGDSPVYYIKLPPVPYYYINNNIHQHHSARPTFTTHTTKYPFQKVDVDFTNNGKPTQVYHWTGSPTTAPFWLPSVTTPRPTTTTTTTTTTPRPTTTTSKPTKRPWLTLNKYFPYNGRPSGVYVYKPRPTVNVNKFKQHYFKHFNY